MIKELLTVGSLMGMGIGGYVFIDDRKADKIVVADALQEQRLETLDYQLDQKTRSIGKINAKINTGEATSEDVVTLEELKADKEWLKERKSTIQK